MSGLENVLGNVYGNKDDQPQKTDLDDVQESMDALVEINDPDGVSDMDESEDPTASTALDELSDWIGAPPDTVAADDDDQENIFATDNIGFLDEDSDEVPSQADPGDEHSSSKLEDIGAEDETAGHSRAEWLDNLDDIEGESGQNWMDDLTEDHVHTEPEAESSAETSVGPERSDPLESTSEEEDLEDLGPTLNDLMAASAPAPAADPEADPGLPADDQDEQWLDDLFSTDLADGPDTDFVDTATMQPPTDEQSAPLPDEMLLDGVGSSTPPAMSHSSDSTSIAGIPVTNEETPAWAQLQATTAEASATAAGMATAGATSGVALGADWIRSDDDILPARGRGKRRKQTLDIVELGPEQDPIELFAPVEADEPKSKRSRKSKREEPAAVKDDASTGKAVKESKPKGSRKSKRKEMDATPPEPSSEALAGSETQAGSEVVEPGDIAKGDETTQGDAPEDSTPESNPASLVEQLADPPVIGDVGMPEAPDAVEAFFLPDDELDEVEAKKPKRKLFKRSSK